MILSLSCEREEISSESDEIISSEEFLFRSTVNFNLTDFQACFDEIANGLNGQNGPVFEERFGRDSEIRIEYEYSSGRSSVIPLITNDEISSLIWMNSESDSYIIKNSAYIPNDEREGTNISPGCVKLFNLAANQLNDLSGNEIQRILGDGFTVSKNLDGIIIIRESESVIVSQDGLEADDVVRPLCDYTELVDFYLVYFGFMDSDGQNTGQYEFDLQIFVDAVTAAVPNDGTCYCIKPCEVISELGANPNVGPYSMNIINQYFLANNNTLELPEDFPIDEISSDILENVSETLCGNPNPNPNPDPSAWPITLELSEEDLAPDLIENGITICSFQGEAEPCTGLDVGGSEDRDSEDDLCHGENDTNAVRGIKFSDEEPALSVADLCGHITQLFSVTTQDFITSAPSELRLLAFEFLTMFKNNRDEDLVVHDIRLSEAVANDVNMQNYMKAFVAEVTRHLNFTCGDIDGLNVNFEINPDPEAEFEQVRPFLGPGNLHTGLRILVNDTEARQVSLDPNSYTFNPDTGDWQASFCFTVCDHFGLDGAEVVSWQFYPFAGKGFAAWYHMQKIHNSVPFETKIYISATLKGTVDC
jgi:hypothetical protein